MTRRRSCLPALGAFGSLAAAVTNFANPVIYQDLADVDIIRVNDTFYYSASSMHYSPGAPVLRSYDLVNWEYLGHSVPVLDFGPQYYLNGSGSAYVGGVWASTMQYRESNGLFYWYGLIQSTGKTHVFTAEQPQGPWTEHTPLPQAYYDCGLLIDTDDTMYMAYGNYQLHVAQLSADGMSQVKSQIVYTEPNNVLIEGSRMYKRNGAYYIFATKPSNSQYILKSTSGPFGPYEIRPVVVNIASPVAATGSPHQGGLVETASGQWYYMAFVDAYPLGRMPVLAPVSWDADGWPVVQTNAAGGWSVTYDMPVVTDKKINAANAPGAFKESFAGQKALSPRWEWNHNPLDSAWEFVSTGLQLTTARVVSEIYDAQNTLTVRTFGPKSQATWKLDVSAMKDGDRAGAAIFRSDSAYIGVHKDNGQSRLVYVDDLDLGANWQLPKTGGAGTVTGGPTLTQSSVWLRVKADVRPGFSSEYNDPRPATFYYSLDGTNFKQLGGAYNLNHTWQFFMAYRFAVFNFATEQTGGHVIVNEHAKQHSLEHLHKSTFKMQNTVNPIIPGFAPDPSIIKHGDFFFLVNSSFHLFPGLPIYASKNLASWEHIGNALNRPEQMSLAKSSTHIVGTNSNDPLFATGGLYAPTLRFHDGVFYIICTNVLKTAGADDDCQNFIISTTDIWEGPWSDPVYFSFAGIDPSLLFDQGRVYVAGSRGPGPSTKINMFELDISTGHKLTDEKTIWTGTGGIYPEGPHVYKRNEVYYLVIAEGGTHDGHMVTMARSSSVWGPYESAPGNPILTARGTDEFVQFTGHCDIFDHKGETWGVCLGVRKFAGGQMPMGRESFLTRGRWDADGWLALERVKMEPEGVTLVEKAPCKTQKAGLDYLFIRDVQLKQYAIDYEQGSGSVTASAVLLSDKSASPSFVGKRQRLLDGQSSVQITSFAPTLQAGMAVYKDEHRFASIMYNAATRKVTFNVTNDAKEIHRNSSADVADVTKVKFKIVCRQTEYTFEYDDGKGWKKLAAMDALDLTGLDFVGPIIGVYVVGEGQAEYSEFVVE
ncbi:hypothetical protein TD95_003630 [Thielaviopsis punctulata]|uniref:Beta-xylosidase C-terminal Concanavalin A-like domain-containing protein n=1 Tax=Thielaviopsis punctulata TaxID=72032 RepID=A0A0F4ZK00_9PEZI|nr:hypothetical protein TD95_003630 [Thielaviopsis punctulata]